jgi:hypothetical protein
MSATAAGPQVVPEPGRSRKVEVLERKLAVNDSVVCAELDDEAVLLNVETGIYFGLDAIGCQIWKFVEQGAGQDEIVQHLLQEYEVEPQDLREDVAEFLTMLQQKGLVRLADE